MKRLYKDPLLDEPMARPPALVSPVDGSAQEYRDSTRYEFGRRMLALMRAYGVEPEDENRWYLLSCRLAAHHVPGFSYEQRGAHGDDLEDLEALYLEIEDIRHVLRDGDVPVRRSKRLPLSRACEYLSKRQTSRFHGQKPSTLRDKYNRYRLKEFGRRSNSPRLAAWSPDGSGLAMPASQKRGDEIIRRCQRDELTR